MKTNIKSLLVALCTLALCGMSSTARAEQRDMNAAIAALEEAKHSRHPIEHLERAKHELDEALEAARHDNHKAMHEHIDRAIHEVREGKHDARKH
jgi:glutamate-1-semialdehyde aminotransferase